MDKLEKGSVLKGPWDLVSKVISRFEILFRITPLRGLVTPIITLLTKPHDPLSRALRTHILRLLGPRTILYKAFGLS